MYKVSIRDLVKYTDAKGIPMVKLHDSKCWGYNHANFNIPHPLFDEMVENSNEYMHYITIDAEYRKKKYKKVIEFYNHYEGVWQLDEMTPEDMELVGEMEYLLVIGK